MIHFQYSNLMKVHTFLLSIQNFIVHFLSRFKRGWRGRCDIISPYSKNALIRNGIWEVYKGRRKKDKGSVKFFNNKLYGVLYIIYKNFHVFLYLTKNWTWVGILMEIGKNGMSAQDLPLFLVFELRPKTETW